MNYLYWERDSNPCHMLERHIAWTASRYPSICGESRGRTYISLLMTGSVQFPSLAEPLYRCRILIFITDILSLWLYITELLIYPLLASYANFAASPYISRKTLFGIEPIKSLFTCCTFSFGGRGGIRTHLLIHQYAYL